MEAPWFQAKAHFFKPSDFERSEEGVLDGVRLATTRLTVNRPGIHTLRIYGLDPGVVLDKLVIDLGGLTPSYLGPPSAKP